MTDTDREYIATYLHDELPEGYQEKSDDNVLPAVGGCECPCHTPGVFVHHTAACCDDLNESL